MNNIVVAYVCLTYHTATHGLQICTGNEKSRVSADNTIP